MRSCRIASSAWRLGASRGVKAPSAEGRQIPDIVDAVAVQDLERQNEILQDLGVTPIWIDDHPLIDGVADRILQP